MEEKIERLLREPCWIVDILPMQVPKDSPGRYFTVEKYFLKKKRLAAIKRKHIRLVLKLNCYRHLTVDGETPELPPEKLAKEMRRRTVCILVDGAMILSEPDDTHMTLFAPDEPLLELVRAIAAGEGLFVWKPPE